MEKRTAMRLGGVSEIELFSTTMGEPICRASIKDMSEGGLLVAYLAPDTRLEVGQKVKFRFVVPTGEVRGTGEVVRAEPEHGELALRMLGIDNESGLPNLMGFLHSAFCGVS